MSSPESNKIGNAETGEAIAESISDDEIIALVALLPAETQTKIQEFEQRYMLDPRGSVMASIVTEVSMMDRNGWGLVNIGKVRQIYEPKSDTTAKSTS